MGFNFGQKSIFGKKGSQHQKKISADGCEKNDLYSQIKDKF